MYLFTIYPYIYDFEKTPHELIHGVGVASTMSTSNRREDPNYFYLNEYGVSLKTVDMIVDCKRIKVGYFDVIIINYLPLIVEKLTKVIDSFTQCIHAVTHVC